LVGRNSSPTAAPPQKNSAIAPLLRGIADAFQARDAGT